MKLFILTALCFSLQSMAFAGLSIPKMESSLHNYSSLNSQDLNVEIEYDCSYITAPWPFGSEQSCGNKVVRAEKKIVSNGEVALVFPKSAIVGFRTPWSDPSYTATVSVSFEKNGKVLRAYLPNENLLSLNYFHVGKNNFTELKNALENISLIYFQEEKVRFVDESGDDALSLLTSVYGKKDNLRMNFWVDGFSAFSLDGNYAITMEEDSFGCPIDEFSLQDVMALKSGKIAGKIDYGFTMRIEPDNWRDYNWGFSWKQFLNFKATLSLVELKKSRYPQKATVLTVDSSWYDFL